MIVQKVETDGYAIQFINDYMTLYIVNDDERIAEIFKRSEKSLVVNLKSYQFSLIEDRLAMGTVFGINVEHIEDIVSEMNKIETVKDVEKLILVFSDNKGLFITKDKLERFISDSMWDVLGNYNSVLENKVDRVEEKIGDLEESIEEIKSVLDKISDLAKIVEEDTTVLRTRAKNIYELLDIVDRKV